MFSAMCNFKALQMKVFCSLLRERRLHELELDHNAEKANRKIVVPEVMYSPKYNN